MARKFIIFDLDGTLIHSIPDMCREISLFLADHGGREISQAEAISVIGNGARHMMTHAFKLIGIELSDSEIESYLKEWISQYSSAQMELTKPWPNVIETLEKLKADGYHLAVCTNKPAGPTKAIMSKLDLEKYFEVILHADSLPVRKPRPEPLWEAVKQMGGSNDQAVMVGDSEADAEAARNAGFPTILLSFGYAHIPLEEIAADVIIDDFADLPKALAKL